MGQFAKVTNIKPCSSWSLVHRGFSQLGTATSMWEIGIHACSNILVLPSGHFPDHRHRERKWQITKQSLIAFKKTHCIGQNNSSQISLIGGPPFHVSGKNRKYCVLSLLPSKHRAVINTHVIFTWYKTHMALLLLLLKELVIFYRHLNNKTKCVRHLPWKLPFSVCFFFFV